MNEREASYFGKPLEDCTKEELIECIFVLYEDSLKRERCDCFQKEFKSGEYLDGLTNLIDKKQLEETNE